MRLQISAIISALVASGLKYGLIQALKVNNWSTQKSRL